MTLVFNDKYKSWQYSPVVVKEVTPSSYQDSYDFLNSILTDRQTNLILSAYPDVIKTILDGKDIDISVIKGIGTIEWLRCKKKIIENYGIADILVMLSPLGVTYNMVQKLLSEESNPELLKQKLLSNPYMMTKIKGLGFKKVDDLALKLNPDLRVSKQRLLAYIRYYFHSIGESYGHTYVTLLDLRKNISDNVNECIDIYDDLIADKESISEFLFNQGDKVGLLEYHETEVQVYNILKELSNTNLSYEFDSEIIEKGIKISERQQGFKFDDEQKQIITSAINQSVVLITGKAGTGKTTLTRALLNICKLQNLSINCCALSAKASQRITEATGFDSSTIHRLLGFQGYSFIHNRNCPLDCDVLLIDECSMINASLFNSLLQAVQEGTKVILCGDNRQLPPIGYGNIFNDLLEFKDEFDIYKLAKVHRQAEKSGILMDANKIRDGIDPINTKDLRIVSGENKDMIYQFRTNQEGLREIAIKSYLNAIDKFGLDNVVIIAPRKDKCCNSTKNINEIIQNALIDYNEPTVKYGDNEFRLGAKVIQRENDYQRNVFNGEIGYITDIDDKSNIIVDFGNHKVPYTKKELSQIQLAYAMTVHLSQGSGYDCVICIIDRTSNILLDNCLLYTALTRAKKKCMLLTEPSAYDKAIRTNHTTSRQTWLSLQGGDV